ncbi:MAG TPA: indoleacetamide hydrolase [Actinophytocola sp.]|uniref:indoleacetamide hydrolase n=1 Tax=Actinophytocola sp. TaxID=1872138 RepID=UPI002DC014EA|nr:indoleacetamide hydrolase [Actinophytocola sp.]HEU5471516.1 indoleacetamide hydrolase [Actinophytocola sp.]
MFLRTSGALGAAVSVAPLAGCGTGGDDMSEAELRELSAAQAIAAIRSGRVNAERYVQALITRAGNLKHLNTLITMNGSSALAAARQIDADREAGRELPALAGLPIVVKDNINFRELPTSAGTTRLMNSKPTTTAPSLQKLLDAGALVLGKANMHELAFGITSTNLSLLAGPVANPYDETRIPGGSSGGTAAAIAARIVPCGLGTDTGGSTRIPPALTGTAGLRPSVGNGGSQRRYTDTNAIVPVSHTRDTVGPMGRTLADVALLDSVITGAPLATVVPLAGLRLAVPASFWAGLDNQLAPIVEAARKKLADARVELVDVDLPGLFELNNMVSFPVALHEPIADLPAYLEASGLTGITLADIAASIASPDVKEAFGGVLADAFGPQYKAAIEIHRPALQKMYTDYFAANRLDAILFPTTILPAAPMDTQHGSSTVTINGGPPAPTFPTYIRNTDPGSNAGIPGISLPAGLTSGGLPVGLALDGPLASDTKLLSIGLAIEALLGRVPGPPL